MFPRVAQATFKGFLQWPDLMVFGLLSFGLTIGLDAIFRPLWGEYLRNALASGSGPSVLPGILGLFAQQIILTIGSIVIAVAAARVVLARLSGGQMSVLDGLRLRPLLAVILSYSLLYAVITSLLSFAYLMFLLGDQGLTFAGELTTTGVTGLSQVPTGVNAGSAALVLLVFFPVLGAWAFVNLLVPPIIASERLGGWTVIARSATLTWRTISVLIGLILTVFALSCVLALVLSFFIVSSADLATLQQMGESPMPVLPELPIVMQAILNALLFVAGAIFTAAWYAAAQEDETLLDLKNRRG